MYLEERLLQAVRKRSAAAFRQVVGGDIAEFEPHKLEWGEINKRQATLLTASRQLLEKIESAPEAELRDYELAHEGLMEVWDALNSEKDHRNEAGSRAPRAQGGSPRRPNHEDRSERRDNVQGGGGSDVIYALPPEQRMAAHHSLRQSADYEGLTEGAYFRSMVIGAKSDVERRALAEGSDSAGGYTVPEVVSAQMIDRMRAAMVCIRAGARTVPLTSNVQHVAKVLTDPLPAWRAEGGAVEDAEPTFGRMTFNPRSLAVLVKCSRELLEDSLNMEQALPAIIAAAMAVEADRVALFGSGTSDEPKGVANLAGVNEVAHNAALTSYVPLVRARTAVLSANAPDVTGIVLSPRDDGALAELVDTQGQPLRLPMAIEKVPFLPTSSVPIDGGEAENEGTIVTGYFPHLLIGVRSSLRIEVLKERYADTLQVGFLAHLRMDVAVEHDASFTKVTGILPTT